MDKIVNDEKNKDLELKKYGVNFSKLAKLILSDLESSNTSNILFKTYTKKQVIDALQSPAKNEKRLRDLSKFLYVISPHYKRLCDYYGQMATLDWYIDPLKLDIDKVNIKIFKKTYSETLDYLDNMNIKHEFSKIMQIVFREGVLYGYVNKSDETFFVKKLNPDNCKLVSIEDGVCNFAFDFSVFSRNEDLLNSYAPEFRKKYDIYKKSIGRKKNKKEKKQDYKFQELDSKNTIYIKSDETVEYPFPPFVGVIPDVYEIQDYKALKKASQEMQNVAILVGSIPYLKNESMSNAFALDLDTAIDFGNKVNEGLPDQFGFLLSVYDKMELFRLNEDSSSTDKIQEAVGNFWESTGTTKDLFTGTGSTDASQKRATATDEQIVFNLLLQIERWINRDLKFNNKKYKFKIHLLPMTNFNQTDFVNRELKAAQFGVPNKIRLAVSMGMSQSSIMSMAFLENTILELHDNWIPLNSSHTTSGSESADTINDNKGRPSQETNNQNSDGGEE